MKTDKMVKQYRQIAEKPRTCTSNNISFVKCLIVPKILSEYDQEIPQSQTADNPWHRKEETLNHHETPGRQTKQSNQLSFPLKMIAILEWT